MPIPFILGAVAAVTAVTGIGAGVYGASKIKDAKDTMDRAQSRHERNIRHYEDTQGACNTEMDELGTLEMKILNSFERFSDLIEKIQNRPKFEEIDLGDRTLPRYDPQHLREVSLGAGVLLGSLGGAAAGTAGGMAAAGGVTAAVMALGSASTGTAIASLSGVAATNATLALLGGGAIAAGGGGVALGSTLLGAATLGVGLMVGGAIFAFTGSKLSDKADEAWDQMKRAEEKIDTVCTFLNELKEIAVAYKETLKSVQGVYDSHMDFLADLLSKKRDWNTFSDTEKRKVENLVHLVSLLYSMCKVKLVLKSEDEKDLNTVNKADVNKQMTQAEKVLDQIPGL